MRQKINPHFIVICIIALAVFIDLGSKYLVEQNFRLHETKDIWGSFFQLILIYNKGGVFGIAQGKSYIFLIISFFVLGFLIYTYLTYPYPSWTFRVSTALILGGALGNMYDRTFNPNGVVDFLYFGWDEYASIFGQKIFLRWPAFNAADAFILIGAVVLAVLFWKNEKK